MGSPPAGYPTSKYWRSCPYREAMFHPSLAPEVEECSDLHLNLDLNVLPEASYFKEKVETKEIWGVEDRVDGLKINGVSRVCVECQVTKTPLWRSGPRGPKSLCNACGIRYRKRRKAAALGFQKEDKEKQGRRKRVGVPLKFNILRNEEEEAAVLLMALSCGSVYA